MIDDVSSTSLLVTTDFRIPAFTCTDLCAGTTALDIGTIRDYVQRMAVRHLILIVTVAAQFVIAVHPAFVNQFAYASSPCTLDSETPTPGLCVASPERPVEVVVAHRVPKLFRTPAVISTCVTCAVVRVTASTLVRPESDPAFLAESSRRTFLRQRSLLI